MLDNTGELLLNQKYQTGAGLMTSLGNSQSEIWVSDKQFMLLDYGDLSAKH